MSRDDRNIPPRLGYRPALDGVRAVAIAGVLAAHGGFAPGGSLGVTAFFTLSGFLITTLLLEERAGHGDVDLRTFYLRRVFRLYPALVLALLATIAVTLVHHPPVDDHMSLAYPAALFYFANVVPIVTVPHALGSIVWTWSLSVEEQFYLLWPPLCRRLLRRPAPAAHPGALRGLRRLVLVGAALVVFSLCMRGFVFSRHAGDPHGYYGTVSRMDALLVGCLAAIWRQRQLRRDGFTVRAPGLLALAGLAAIVAMYPLPLRLAWHDPVVAAATAGVLLAVTEDRGCLVARFLSFRPVVRLGKISYGLYVYNMLCFAGWALVARHEPRGPAVVGWIALTIAVAEVSYRLVERPLLRRAPRPPAGAGAAQPYPSRAGALEGVAEA